jgi:hypothetical protein
MLASIDRTPLLLPAGDAPGMADSYDISGPPKRAALGIIKGPIW